MGRGRFISVVPCSVSVEAYGTVELLLEGRRGCVVGFREGLIVLNSNGR